MTATNKDLAKRASELAKGSDGLQRKAANIAAVALGTTSSVASARNVLSDLWQKDLQAAALGIIRDLASQSARAAWTDLADGSASDGTALP